MNTKLNALLAASIATVGAAHAVTVNFQSIGTGSYTAPTALTRTFSGSDSAPSAGSPALPPSFTFVSLAYSVSQVFSPTVPSLGTSTGTGTLVLHNVPTNADVTFNFTIAGGASKTATKLGYSSGNFISTSGIFTLTGKLSSTLTTGMGMTSGDTNSTFIGTVTPVPEPASMAALAIGGLGLLRRRRKA